MEEFGTYEYTVLRGREKSVMVKKTLLIFAYILFVLLWLTFGILTRLVPLLALIPVTLWMFIFFTWRYTNVEYEYSVTSGNVVFSEIYGNRTRKKKIEAKLKDFSLIAPYDSRENIEAANTFGGRVIYMVPSSDVSEQNPLTLAKDDKQVYFATYEKSGSKIIIYFMMTNRMLKICRFYNPSAFTSGWNRSFH